jgi:hypothetical protein
MGRCDMLEIFLQDSLVALLMLSQLAKSTNMFTFRLADRKPAFMSDHMQITRRKPSSSHKRRLIAWMDPSAPVSLRVHLKAVLYDCSNKTDLPGG